MTVFVALLALILLAGVSVKVTLFSSQQVRRMRWRIMVWLRPGPGFATLAELAVRWSRLAAVRHGRRARPSMRLHHRATSRTTAYAIRLGRAATASARLAGLLVLYTLRFILAAPETARGLRRIILQAAPLPPVQPRTDEPYVRTGHRTGPWPVPAVDRDAVIARLADEIRDAIEAGTRWQPDYPALMQATGRRRSWCEKAVRDARTAVFDTPDRDGDDARADSQFLTGRSPS